MNSISNNQQPACPVCDSPLRIELVDETMSYTTPSGPVNLQVTVPYEVCSSCGYRGFGEAGEKARTDAIYKYHELLTPWEIVAIRTSLGLSQMAYAEILGVGHASLERWELGTKMQNVSMNNLILCLSKRSQVEWLQNEKRMLNRIDEFQKKVVSLDRFKCLTLSDENTLREQSNGFMLRLRA